MRRTALGGNVRGFIMSCSRKQRVHIIVSLLVSAADYRKPTHWQLIGTTHGEDHQSARRHLMRMFCNISRTASPQASVRLLMNCVLIFVWCGTFYASSISMLPVSRSCRLWAPTITFVETNLCFGLCGTVRRSPNFLLCVCVCVNGWGLLHPGRVCNTNKSCFGRNKPSCCICSLPPPTTLCAWILIRPSVLTHG